MIPFPRRPRTWRGSPPKARMTSAILAALLFLPVACEIPTEAPKWDQRWLFPIGSASIPPSELLPEGPWGTDEDQAFFIQFDTFQFFTTLGDLCPECVPLWGLQAPKPAFEGVFSGPLLPEGMVSAEVIRADMTLEIRNGFNFDPIRPDSAVFGEIVLQLRSGGIGGNVLDQATIDGREVALPQNTTESVALSFSGTVPEGSVALAQIVSPAGSTVRIDITDRATVTVVRDILRVSSAVMEVGGRTFELPAVDLGTGELASELVDRVESGAVELRIVNPWNMSADLLFEIFGPTVAPPIQKTVTLPASPESVLSVELTAQELQAFLGEPDVKLRGEAMVPLEAPPAQIRPGQSLEFEVNVDLVLAVGGQGGGA